MRTSSSLRTFQAAGNRNQNLRCRLFAAKSPNRAAFHGAGDPVTQTLEDREKKMEEEIKKAKEEREKEREEVQKRVDSTLNESQKPKVTHESPESLGTS